MQLQLQAGEGIGFSRSRCDGDVADAEGLNHDFGRLPFMHYDLLACVGFDAHFGDPISHRFDDPARPLQALFVRDTILELQSLLSHGQVHILAIFDRAVGSQDEVHHLRRVTFDRRLIPGGRGLRVVAPPDVAAAAV